MEGEVVVSGCGTQPPSQFSNYSDTVYIVIYVHCYDTPVQNIHIHL